MQCSQLGKLTNNEFNYVLIFTMYNYDSEEREKWQSMCKKKWVGYWTFNFWSIIYENLSHTQYCYQNMFENNEINDTLTCYNDYDARVKTFTVVKTYKLTTKNTCVCEAVDKYTTQWLKG